MISSVDTEPLNLLIERVDGVACAGFAGMMSFPHTLASLDDIWAVRFASAKRFLMTALRLEMGRLPYAGL